MLLSVTHWGAAVHYVKPAYVTYLTPNITCETALVTKTFQVVPSIARSRLSLLVC